MNSIALFAATLFLAGSSAAPAAQPKATFSVPAACADVWKEVYTGVDPAWQVTVLAPRPADERLPEPEALEAFIAAVPGLEAALVKFDAADKDIFFVRVHTRALDDLKKKYPKFSPSLLEAAKLQACRDVQ